MESCCVINRSVVLIHLSGFAQVQSEGQDKVYLLYFIYSFIYLHGFI